jgi:hypothetical protein
VIGLLILIAAVVAMYRIADIEGKSGALWGAITLIFCLAMAFLLPAWPLVNIGLGGILSFIAMFIYKVVKD